MYAGSYVNQHRIGSSVSNFHNNQKTYVRCSCKSISRFIVIICKVLNYFRLCNSSHGQVCVFEGKEKKKTETHIVMRFCGVRAGSGNCESLVTYHSMRVCLSGSMDTRLLSECGRTMPHRRGDQHHYRIGRITHNCSLPAR